MFATAIVHIETSRNTKIQEVVAYGLHRLPHDRNISKRLHTRDEHRDEPCRGRGRRIIAGVEVVQTTWRYLQTPGDLACLEVPVEYLVILRQTPSAVYQHDRYCLALIEPVVMMA